MTIEIIIDFLKDYNISYFVPFQIPQVFFSNIDSSTDWGYRNVPQENACRSYKTKNCAWPRGKVLGGCSSINGIFYVRGNKLDYDEWAAAGNKGWSYEEVLPYFKKSENYSEILTDTTQIYHNKGGYMYVEQSQEDLHDFEKMIIQAGVELGLKLEVDINGANQMGISKSATNIYNGVRQSTARAFLSPIKDRKNFHVLKHALATKLLFEPGTNIVSGVVVNKDGQEIRINARKEVIISAGAINTPQLLMLSGIGPKKHLEELGIDVKADLPVGENLQDHPFVPIYYKLPADKSMTSFGNIVGMFAQFLLERKGLLASTSPFRVISFMNTTDRQATSPDMQYHYIFFPPNTVNFVDTYSKHKLSDEFQKKFQEINEENIILSAFAVLLRPKSKGKILLQSTDPFEHPLIYANYFHEPEDLETIMRSFKQHGLKIGETKTMKGVGFEQVWLDLDACRKYDKNSDEFLKCWSSELTTSLYHPTSTAKMGPDNDETAVVNSELKVRKVKNLRVIDASIMPDIVRGNTHAPTVMIGEKGADMIKQSWLQRHTEL